MPFDAVPTKIQIDPVAALLRRAELRLSDPARWTQGTFRRYTGETCLMGALVTEAVGSRWQFGFIPSRYGKHTQAAAREIANVLRRRGVWHRGSSLYEGIAMFNDRRSTDHREVLSVVREALTMRENARQFVPSISARNRA